MGSDGAHVPSEETTGRMEAAAQPALYWAKKGGWALGLGCWQQDSAGGVTALPDCWQEGEASRITSPFAAVTQKEGISIYRDGEDCENSGVGQRGGSRAQFLTVNLTP